MALVGKGCLSKLYIFCIRTTHREIPVLQPNYAECTCIMYDPAYAKYIYTPNLIIMWLNLSNIKAWMAIETPRCLLLADSLTQNISDIKPLHFCGILVLVCTGFEKQHMVKSTQKLGPLSYHNMARYFKYIDQNNTFSLINACFKCPLVSALPKPIIPGSAWN